MRAHAAAILLLSLVSLTACTPRKVHTVEAFRDARDRGDLDAARALMSDDPRVWWEQKEGEGALWTLGSGRWKAWDEHFNSEGDLGPWQWSGDEVYAIVTEWNDYFELIEREDQSRYRLTYYFNDDGLISGYMISDVDPAHPDPSSVDRSDEIEAWAIANDPDEWAYLRPDGKLDPTGDRPERTRALINQWRKSVGLEPIE